MMGDGIDGKESLNSREDKSEFKIKRTILSYVTNSWLDTLLYKGYKSPLKEEDLPRFEDDMTTESGTVIFKEFWDEYYYSVKTNGEKPLLNEFMAKTLKWQSYYVLIVFGTLLSTF